MNRIKIFISSVQNEFAKERRQIADYIRQDSLFSMYFDPFLFEELPAQDKSAQTAYLEQAADAGIYLLLLGKRYGYEDENGISPTEREYDTATASHAYRIAFIKEMQEREPKEELFKQKIDGAVIRNSFNSYEELKSGVYAHSAQVDVTPELPAQAVTEAIVNAVVHRNYTSNGSVQVMLLKDRLEIWNPGKLPQGMTIAKLTKEHTSNPVNPVLANPVYLSGYIEQMGTGTTDIIDHCLEYGLRKPEFHQDEDFRVILWRPEVQEGGKERVQERGTEGGEVRGEVRGEVKGEVDGKIKKVVLAVRGNTISANEIMKSLQLKGEDNFRKRYLVPSIENGYVQMLYPDAPRRPDQAYYLTEKGLALYAEISKRQ